MLPTFQQWRFSSARYERMIILCEWLVIFFCLSFPWVYHFSITEAMVISHSYVSFPLNMVIFHSWGDGLEQCWSTVPRSTVATVRCTVDAICLVKCLVTPWQNHGELVESWFNSHPIGSMVLLYMVTFTMNIPQMLAYTTSTMDPMGMIFWFKQGNKGDTPK
jgi:hypothetical protein